MFLGTVFTLRYLLTPSPTPTLYWLLWVPAVLLLFIALPVAGVIANVFFSGASWEVLKHLASTVLWQASLNSLLLGALVALGVCLVGVSGAWLTTVYDFPGRRWLAHALLLPLAMPAYVMAYAYTDLLQFAGPVQSGLREFFDWQKGDYWFPEIRSLSGAAFLFVFVLYPYVYVLARASFIERSQIMTDAARSLGCNGWQAFWRVSLPLVRPAMVAGAALAVMETLADYGAVAYFGITTFTTSIYRAWFNLGDRATAAQLATALMTFVVLVLLFEQRQRGRARYDASAQSVKGQPLQRLHGGRACAAMLLCLVPVVTGFILPAALLLHLKWQSGTSVWDSRFLDWVGNTVTLGLVTAGLAVLLALLMTHVVRQTPRPWVLAGQRLAALGYAIPGAIIAVGILIPLASLDNWLADRLRDYFGWNTGLLLTGTIMALIYAYLVRFYAIAAQTIESGYARITPAMEWSARSLGLSPPEVLRRVHVPLLSRSLLAAALLVFVDVMKELPATLVLRPFNYDTLAVVAHQFASDERLAEAALPALAIVVSGLIPVLLLSKSLSKSG
jgi:iron(III) transport system permease protein